MLGSLLALAAVARTESTGASRNVQVELIPEVESVQPGTPFWVGVRLKMAPHWHTYWLNPGDAGLPTKMKWTLPDGFEAGTFQWPYPQAISAPPLMSYGYEHEILLLTQVRPPADLAPGSSVTLGGRLSWLECEKICLPGKAQLEIELPVRATTPAPRRQGTEMFSRARGRLPGDGSNWQTRTHAGEQIVAVSFQTPRPGLQSATFFPEDKEVIDYAAPQQLVRTDTGYRVDMKPADSASFPEVLAGVLVFEDAAGTRAVRLEAPTQKLVRALPPGMPVVPGVADASTPAGVKGIAVALVLAFVGGLILNLMPCVLPVLSLKVFSFIQHAGGDRKVAWRQGLAFAAGVLSSFWALAGTLLLLRAAGEQIGWGFQLQSPGFVVFLACLFFLIGLNLFGVFEVGLSLTSTGGALQGRKGYAGSFASGTLATIVATPCTAPFMGSALGFALAQPAYVALLIFTSLGLGMALPYLVLSLTPGLLRYVPKPGPWMETFKQLMGFFMMGTVVVLVWIFGRQAGLGAVTALLGSFVILALAAWIYGIGTVPDATVGKRRVALALASVFLAAGLFVGFNQAHADPTAAGETAGMQDGIAWEPFSFERLAELRSAGKPVFIDFTAAWCLSCQVNERMALGASRVQERFRTSGIVALKADWTLHDEMITRALASYGRRGVPLYVLYGPGSEQPRLLPEVITPGIVLDALAEVVP